MASIRKPVCGSIETHDPHTYPGASAAPPWTECGGCGERESSTLAAIEALRDAASADMAGAHELALYCHPMVRYAMLNQIVPGYEEFTAAGPWDFTQLFGIPFVVTPGAERGSWRLMDGAGRDELAAGVLSEAS